MGNWFWLFLSIIPLAGRSQERTPLATVGVPSEFYPKTETQDSASTTDSIPRQLISDLVYLIPPISWTPPPYIPDIYIPYPDYYTWIPCVLTITLEPPACGDTYHSNGTLATRVSCVDSIREGKSTYWDETGHKYSEETYSSGVLIKSKTYDTRGRMTNMSHYDYQGNLHGVVVNQEFQYDFSSRTVTHYDHGLLHGLKQEYQNNALLSETQYKNNAIAEKRDYRENGVCYYIEKMNGDYPAEIQQFGETGQLVYHERMDSLGRTTSKKVWNESGVLLEQRQFVNGQPVGTFLDYHDPQNNIRKETHYENGQPVKTEERQGEMLIAEIIYDKGVHHHSVSFFGSGDTSWYYKPGTINYQKKWKAPGQVSDEFWYTASNNFIGQGYYTYRDTLFWYEATNSPNSMIPIKRWAMVNQDTVRMDYVRNDMGSVAYQPLSVLASNHYRYDPGQGRWVRHGVWKEYFANHLRCVYTYEYGKCCGRAVYYYTDSNAKPMEQYGIFCDGTYQGEWTTVGPDGTTVYTYVNGVPNGEYRTYDRFGSLMVLADYVNGQITGRYHSFFNSQPKTQEEWFNGIRHGYARYYNDFGELILEGEWVNNVRVGIWWQYSYRRDGTVDRTKIRYKKTPEKGTMQAV